MQDDNLQGLSSTAKKQRTDIVETSFTSPPQAKRSHAVFQLDCPPSCASPVYHHGHELQGWFASSLSHLPDLCARTSSGVTCQRWRSRANEDSSRRHRPLQPLVSCAKLRSVTSTIHSPSCASSSIILRFWVTPCRAVVCRKRPPQRTLLALLEMTLTRSKKEGLLHI